MAKYLGDLVKDVHADQRVSLTQPEIEAVLRVALEKMGDYLADMHKVYLIGFMNLEPRDYKQKISRNPETGEEMIIHPYRSVSGKPSDSFKRKLANAHKRDYS